MNYINADLRKNNLPAEVADSLAKAVSVINAMFFKTQPNVLATKKQPPILDANEYYQKAPVRRSAAVSIERELIAGGSAW